VPSPLAGVPRISNAILLTIFVGCIASAIWSCGRHNTGVPGSTLDLYDLPGSVGDLVAQSDAIVVASVETAELEGHTVTGYAAGQIALTAGPAPTGAVESRSPLVLPLTRCRLSIEEVLLDDGVVGGDGPIFLRMDGDITDYATPTPADLTDPNGRERMYAVIKLCEPGDRFLYFLKRDPEAGVYGLSLGAHSRLDISGTAVTLSTNPPLPVDFAENTAAPAFLRELRETIANR
jgi:hypothetical protein